MAITTDCLVLGSGIAGLTFALSAARHGNVVVVTKRTLEEGSTAWAQGGVAAVLAALGCGRTVPDDGCPDGVPPCSGAPPTCQNANIQL